MSFFKTFFSVFQIFLCVFFGIHDYSEGSCETPAECSKCYHTKAPAPGHNYVDGSCTACGQREVYGLGETWVVDGMWELTVNSVKPHILCNKYENDREGYTNEQVVLVEYTYKNIGRPDHNGSGLYIRPETVYDEKMVLANDDYFCYCGYQEIPEFISIGSSCRVVMAVALENDSDEITIIFSQTDSYKQKHTVTFKVPVGQSGNSNNNASQNSKLGLDETWVVDDQWELTVNSVTPHRFCNDHINEYYELKNKQVVLVSYTYKNLHYLPANLDRLYMYPDEYYDESMREADGYLCSCGARKYPQEIIMGASCDVVDAVVLEKDSDEMTIYFEQYDDEGVKYTATFVVPIEDPKNEK